MMRRRHFLLGVPVLRAQTERGITPLNRAPARKALLIGNANYTAAPLVNPVHDAKDLGESLKKLGFQITVVTNAGYSAITSAVETFAASLGAGDVAVLFFSGHGLQLDGENYVVPIEFRAATVTQAKQSAVPFGRLKGTIEKSRAAVAIMVLDSCRNNPFAVAGQSAVPGLAALEAGLGSYIAFAASPGQTASDNAGERNGLFTKHLLQTLHESLHVSELFREVRRGVYEASSQKQLLYVHDQVIGDFYLKAPANAVPPAQTGGLVDFEEATRLYHQSRCQEAAVMLDRVVRQDSRNAFAHNALGLAYRCHGMSREAERSFSTAITVAPAYAAAYLNRGQLYLANTQYMLGNLSEWTADRYQPSLSGGTDPQGPATGNDRVMRGGSWYGNSSYLRASLRYGFGPSVRSNDIGFRCAWE